MVEKFPKILIFFVVFLLVGNIANAYTIPNKIKIIKESGITVRSTIDPVSERLDAVYHDYLYDVIDVNVMYYKIKNKDDVEGWIYNNNVQNWVEEIDSDNGKRAKINLSSGITMRSEPYDKTSKIVGLAEFMEVYEILDVVFSHFKIKTPSVEGGWIYAGRPNDLWVESGIENLNRENSNDVKSKVQKKLGNSESVSKSINKLD